MLKLILGKLRTGKSKYIMDMMDENVQNLKSVYIFVPSQMRMLSEEKYLEYQKKDGILNINFTTISEFVSEYIEKHHLDKDLSYISKTDRKIIMNKIISENSDIIELFKKSKNAAGFASVMQIYMDLFKKGEIKKEDIDSLDEEKNPLISMKLKEIYGIYEKYLEEVSKNYIDSLDEINLFLDNFEVREDVAKNTYLYFDSYNNFTALEQKLVIKLAKLGFNVTVAITCNLLDFANDVAELKDINSIENILRDEKNEDSIFGKYNLTAINIIKDAKVNSVDLEIIPFLSRKDKGVSEDIIKLADSLFLEENSRAEKTKTDDIHVSFASNMYSELENIARIILDKLRNGYRYKDFAIFCSNVDEYKDAIKNIFIQYGLKLHIDDKVKLTSNAIYKYIYNILSMCTYELNLTSLMNILKLNILSLDRNDIAYFENFALEHGILSEFKLKKEIDAKKCDNYDVGRLNKFKKDYVDVLLSLKNEILKQKTTEGIVKCIYDNLEETNALNNLEISTEMIEKSSDSYLKYVASLNILVFEHICDIFTSMSKIYSGASMNIRKFFEVFKGATSDISVKSIPAAIDEIEMLDINVSKIMPRKVLFFVSVNEGKMPLEVKEDSIFSDRDMLLLKNDYDISFKENSFSKLLLEKYNIYEAINCAKEEAYFSFLGADKDGKQIRRSDIITDILNIFDIKAEDVSKNEKSIYITRDLLELLNFRVRNKEFGDETYALYELLLENTKYEDVVRYIRNSDSLSKETLDKMYKDAKIKSSISRLEQFKRCPFSYFIKYSLNVEERKEYKISSLDLGSFMHSVLEQFSRYLFESNVLWHEILDSENKYTKVITEIIDYTLESQLYRHKENVKYDVLKRKLNESMKKAIFTIAKGFNQSKFYPYAIELEFSENTEYLPIEVKLSDDKTMLLRRKN
ncbi:MAG: PD-(D/E)XK nuclease family protein [Clostridia bacterium]|nr:PD-(D/E)XK nuclease family protein [Clostridia bacterium]